MTRPPARPRHRRSGSQATRRQDAAFSRTRSTHFYRWLNALIMTGVLAVNLLQHPGTTTFDTKLDLTQDPAGFLHRALSVWTPEIDMGSLQNQAYGYLFPVGPFFALGHELGAQMWFWQRLWSAALMLVAYFGMERATRELRTVGREAAVLAALAYAMAPRILMTVGVLSGESIPAAVLPWTLVPLLRAWGGRTSWARAVLFSAATVPFMSGLNASEVICALLLPFLVIVCAPLPALRRLRLTLGWSTLIGVVCAWWIGPLLILGKYAPPFLDYIESATVTTAPMTWTTVLRGDSHWVAFLPVSVSHWETGHALTYTAFLVVTSALVGVLGLAGLTLTRFPQRRPFLLATVLALVIMALGHGGWGGTPLAGAFRSFLDGPGAPFRNIHKLDPVARIGVSIGLAMVVTRLRPFAAAAAARRRVLPQAVARSMPMAAVAALVLLVGLPAYQGRLRAADGWQQIPQPWRQMEQRLEALPAHDRVLILPGSGFAGQTWGRTVDELAQTMPGVSWAVRSQVPLVSPGGIRLLDSIEQQMGAGEPVHDLAASLADAGFTHVLVRDDLTPDPLSSTPSAARVEATLDSSGGFRRGPSFGRSPDGGPMLQLYSIDGARPGTLPRAVPMSQVRTLYGEAGQLLSLRAHGALGARELALSPTIGATSPTVGTAGVLTEGAARRERNFGRVHDAVTSVRTAEDPWETARAAHDYAAVTTRRLTTVDYGAIRSVTASSTVDDVRGFGPVRSDGGPWAAFDGRDDTQFVTGLLSEPRGQWVQADLTSPRRVGRITVRAGTPKGAITAVRVTTDQGSRTLPVPAGGTVSTAALGGRTSFVRVTVEAVRDIYVSQVGIAGVDLEDVHPQRTEDIAGRAGRDTTMAFSTWSGRNECITARDQVRCDPLYATTAEEAAGMARRVQLTQTGRWDVQGTVRITSGRLVNSLLRPLGRGVTLQASTIYHDQPLLAPMRAMDGNPATGWTSDEGDKTPWLDLAWGQRRKIGGFSLAGPGRSGPGGEPRVTSVTVDGKPVTFRRDGNRFRLSKPTKGRSMRVNLSSPSGRPIGVSEITVPALADLVYRPSATYATSLPCGFGPTITVDGTSMPTRVMGTIGALTSGAAMKVLPCGHVVALSPGSHRLAMKGTADFLPATLTFTPAGEHRTAQRDLPVEAVTWTAERRTVRIGGRAEALLSVPENRNAGWTATLDGKTLQPVTVDGWGQGFVVPAGSGRTVELSYRPAPTYRAALFAGALGVLVVWLVAAALGASAATARAGRTPRWVALKGAQLRAAVKVRQSTRMHVRVAHVPQVHWLLPCGVLVLGMLVLGGVAPAAGMVIGIPAARRRRSLAVWTTVAVALSALLWSLRPESGAVTGVTDVISGVAFGALVSAAWTSRHHNRRVDGGADA